MPQAVDFLHTTHRTVSWFRKTFQDEELEIAPPFQRNPVWSDNQKSYLIDTILHGFPIPELYMHDVTNEQGEERHIVVDGQQRIRAVLDFLHGDYALEGEEVASRWRGLNFEALEGEEKKQIFGYKFVIRILPPMEEEELRKIFARLNRNVVALNDQELRNATYWGPFIKTIQNMADDDPFWSDCTLFSANDHRRMLDHEYISELAIAFLHGSQNKKDNLDKFYQMYEQEFEDRDHLVNTFRKVTGETAQIIPNMANTRWRKKSDFYTMFLVFASKSNEFPWPADKRTEIAGRLIDFGNQVDRVSRLEESDWDRNEPNVVKYARNVARAASDRANRNERASAFRSFVLQESE